MMKCIQIGMQPELVARNPSRNPSTTEESSKSTDDIEEAVPILNGDVYRLQVYDFERMNQVNDAMKLFYDERKLSIVSQVRNYIHMFEVVESYWKIISFFGQCFHDFASINDSDRRIAVNHAHLYIYPIIFSFAYRKSVNGAPMMIDPKCNTGILIRNDNLSPNPKINQTIIEWSKLFHDMMDDDIVIRNLLISYQLFNQPVEKVKEKYNKHVYDYLLQKYLHYKYKDETKANNQYQELIRVAREFPTADEKFLQQYAQSVNPMN
ncbi:hypothetical protein RDWZM_000141 [Blomia tropicalis]|uniref:Uncharacterized protein n=1 Tax=Blomia tropicalis TaxID=40697 RepID=A0A9Q0M917_BLOTA|nr:hypothetical protein RDWZM_000141 [Blomia tropicalis]